MPTLTLHTGRVVSKGMRPHTPAYRDHLRAAYAPFGNHHKLRALPPPPALIVNSVGVVLDNYGNGGVADPNDTSYTGDPVGDCTCNTLATAMVVLSQCTNLSGGQLVFAAAMVVNWYFSQTGGVDSGCNILDVLDALENTPMTDTSGKPWTIGPSGVIDYTSQPQVQQALNLFKVLDMGVDASPLEAVVGNSDGWVVSGVKRPITNYDHSVPVFDFGTAGAIFDAWKIPLPTNAINADTVGVGGSTWGTKGFYELESYINMSGEAHAIITAPARGDSTTWNQLAALDYTDLTNQPAPTPAPPTPAPAPSPWCNRNVREAVRHLLTAGHALLGG